MEGYVKVGVGVATVGVVAGLIGLAIYTYKRCKKRKSIILYKYERCTCSFRENDTSHNYINIKMPRVYNF